MRDSERFLTDDARNTITKATAIPLLAVLVVALNLPADPTIGAVAIGALLAAASAFLIDWLSQLTRLRIQNSHIINGFVCTISCMFFFVVLERFEVIGSFGFSRFGGFGFFVINGLLAGAITLLLWLVKSKYLDKLDFELSDIATSSVVLLVSVAATIFFAKIDMTDVLALLPMFGNS